MFTVTYAPENFHQSQRPTKVESDTKNGDIQCDLKKVLNTEQKLISLQLAYINAVDECYSRNPPFRKNISDTLPQDQDIDCYLQLICQCLYSNNMFLLHKWGIDYVQKHDVLDQPKDFYIDYFKTFSDPKNCQEVRLAAIWATYFKYLYEHFPKN
jgi:hypothetical protein